MLDRESGIRINGEVDFSRFALIEVGLLVHILPFLENCFRYKRLWHQANCLSLRKTAWFWMSGFVGENHGLGLVLKGRTSVADLGKLLSC